MTIGNGLGRTDTWTDLRRAQHAGPYREGDVWTNTLKVGVLVRAIRSRLTWTAKSEIHRRRSITGRSIRLTAGLSKSSITEDVL